MCGALLKRSWVCRPAALPSLLMMHVPHPDLAERQRPYGRGDSPSSKLSSNALSVIDSPMGPHHALLSQAFDRRRTALHTPTQPA